MDPGDAGNLGDLADQLDAELDPLAFRIAGAVEARDHLVGNVDTGHMGAHPTRGARRGQRANAGQDETFLVQAKVALGKLVDRLEAKGWVERRADPGDRRVKRIYLTASALPIVESMREPAQDLYETIVAGLSKDQRETLIDLLLVVKKNLIEDIARAGE